MRMKDKAAVLFRGLSELGLAAAEAMIKEGASKVIILDEQSRFGEKAAALQEKNPDCFEFMPVDPSDFEALGDTVKQLEEKYPAIHALVNFQGDQVKGGLLDTTEEEWQHMLNANLFELFHSCHYLVPIMKKAGYGRVVNMTSMAGRQDDGSGVANCAMKTGITGFTRALAMELRECGITVNSIAAGDITDNGIMNAVVHAVIYLASDEASWTTGDCMDVNGGRFMQN